MSWKGQRKSYSGFFGKRPEKCGKILEKDRKNVGKISEKEQEMVREILENVRQQK